MAGFTVGQSLCFSFFKGGCFWPTAFPGLLNMLAFDTPPYHVIYLFTDWCDVPLCTHFPINAVYNNFILDTVVLKTTPALWSLDPCCSFKLEFELKAQYDVRGAVLTLLS